MRVCIRFILRLPPPINSDFECAAQCYGQSARRESAQLSQILSTDNDDALARRRNIYTLLLQGFATVN